MPGRIVIGTSSWTDPGFVEEWYPPDLPASHRLAWYAERFEAVEVNSTFYAVPATGTVRRWAEVTPPGFTFDVKLHRLLSRHAAGPDALPPPLRDDVDVTPRGRVMLTPELEHALARHTLDAVAPLAQADKLATFLLQLSPAFEPRRHELDELVPLLDHLAPHPVAVEFRHFAWLTERHRDATLDWLEQHAAVFVCVDAPQGARVPTIVPLVDATTRDDVAYLRAHGRNLEGFVRGRSVAERFAYRYSDQELREIGERAQGLAQEVSSVRLMFNNNRGSDAPVAAARMCELLGQSQAAVG
jgi:uncharacterized protein YecE (DUF72 family)